VKEVHGGGARTDCGKRAETLTTRNSLLVLKKAEDPTLMRATHTPPLRVSREREAPAALVSWKPVLAAVCMLGME
jgi:hypothetical protein